MTATQWTTVPFLEAAEDATRGHAKTKQRDYLPSGRFPVVDQGRELIGGYTDDQSMLSQAELPVVIFGDHTRCVKYVDFPFGAGADGVKVLRPRPGVDAKFLYYFVRSLPLHDGGYSRHFKYLKEAKVPIPPIAEQRRIAALLDVADALRAKRHQALAKLDTLTQALFIGIFGDPLSRSNASSLTLGDVVEFVGGGTPSKAKPEYFDGSICWATSKDMRGRFLDDTQDHITTQAIRSSATKLVPAGTILVVVKSKILAHTLPVAISRVPTCFGQDLKGLIPSRGVSSEFVAESVRAAQQWLLKQARGVNTEGLTLEQLRRTPVPLTPPGDVDRFTELARGVEAQRGLNLAAAKELDTLFSSMQHRAFRGEL